LVLEIGKTGLRKVERLNGSMYIHLKKLKIRAIQEEQICPNNPVGKWCKIYGTIGDNFV